MTRVTKPCKCCMHPSRLDIDRAIVLGDSVRAIATRFGTTPTNVHRHKKHVADHTGIPGESAHSKQLASIREQSRRLDVTALVWRILDEAERIGQLAEDDGDYRTSMLKLTHLRGIVELVVGKRPTELLEKPEAWADLSPSERLEKISDAERKLAEVKRKTVAELSNGDSTETN